MLKVEINSKGERFSMPWDEERFSLSLKKREVVLRFPGEIRIYQLNTIKGNTIIAGALKDIKKLSRVYEKEVLT